MELFAAHFLFVFTDEISIGFLIKANEAALNKSGMRYKRDYSKPSAGSMVYAYLHNDDAVDYCPVPRLSSLPGIRMSFYSFIKIV